jgi:two-component system clock-associated histidine kinase SasA
MYPSRKNSESSYSTSNLPQKDSLQLLLFVDNRLSSQKNIEEVKNYLNSLTVDFEFQLEVLEISEHPHLVEHFKLVATPALIKINPPPYQTLAGSNLTAQLQRWWYRWQSELEKNLSDSHPNSGDSILQTCLPSSELIHLSDQIFQLQREVKELKQQLEFKDQMLAMLAHDLRSPLTAASIAIETIELANNQTNLEQKEKLQKQLFQQTKSQFHIMNKMITDLLKTSREMNSQLAIVPKKINLIALLEEIINSFQSKFKQKKQHFKQDIPQDLPPVYVDGELIRQVIVNLLENALKYTPPEGEIIISIIHKTTQKIQVSVIDTGSGIPDEKKEKIFEGHFRLKRDETKEGYGIGLALCRQVINAHYGNIWVDNNGNQGSCFRFTLPVYR